MSNEAIKFLDKSYSRADLEGMSVEDLLELRNLIASNLGVAAVKQFKDHGTAVDQTMKALQKYEASADADAGSGEKPKKAKAPKEPKERKLAKPAAAQHVKRPTRKMFDTMQIVKPFDGEEDRAHRSGNYKDGMMIIDAIQGEGTLPWDIYNWEKAGYVKVVPANDDEYAERRAAWYKSQGREDPDVAKERQRKEREEAKAAREAEREAKKKEREEAKAAKAKEREEAKKAKEAEKATKAQAAE